MRRELLEVRHAHRRWRSRMEVATRSGQARAAILEWLVPTAVKRSPYESAHARCTRATWLYCIAATGSSGRQSRRRISHLFYSRHNRGRFLTSRFRIANGTAVCAREISHDPVPSSSFSFAIRVFRHLNLERKWSSRKWSSVVLQRAILIPSYDWDSSRVSGGHPIRIHVLRRSSERAKLFDQRERKISGILPEAVNLARKPILLTLIGPMTERRRNIAWISISACSIF